MSRLKGRSEWGWNSHCLSLPLEWLIVKGKGIMFLPSLPSNRLGFLLCAANKGYDKWLYVMWCRTVDVSVVSIRCVSVTEEGYRTDVSQVSGSVAAGEGSGPTPRILDHGRGGIDGRRRGKPGRWVGGGPQAGGTWVLAPPVSRLLPPRHHYHHSQPGCHPLSSFLSRGDCVRASAVDSRTCDRNLCCLKKPV